MGHPVPCWAGHPRRATDWRSRRPRRRGCSRRRPWARSWWRCTCCGVARDQKLQIISKIIHDMYFVLKNSEDQIHGGDVECRTGNGIISRSWCTSQWLSEAHLAPYSISCATFCVPTRYRVNHMVDFKMRVAFEDKETILWQHFCFEVNHNRRYGSPCREWSGIVIVYFLLVVDLGEVCEQRGVFLALEGVLPLHPARVLQRRVGALPRLPREERLEAQHGSWNLNLELKQILTFALGKVGILPLLIDKESLSTILKFAMPFVDKICKLKWTLVDIICINQSFSWGQLVFLFVQFLRVLHVHKNIV